MANTATYIDVHVGDDLAHAIEAGASESTVESQHVKAIAALTAVQAQSAQHQTALTNALALLNANLSHLRDPIHH